ncbi:hypothetical protein FOA52_003354 [Chlamydomonas sp. UWO 241]|nr:hypothetical protein FOA52_003354 [Chlamydomonas sp. UWO 241]
MRARTGSSSSYHSFSRDSAFCAASGNSLAEHRTTASAATRRRKSCVEVAMEHASERRGDAAHRGSDGAIEVPVLAGSGPLAVAVQGSPRRLSRMREGIDAAVNFRAPAMRRLSSSILMPGQGMATPQALMTLVAEPGDALTLCLGQIEHWQFDTFALEVVTNGHALSVLAFHLFKRGGLIAELGLDETRLARFLMFIEQGYPPNPYHCAAHAADVLRSTHVILTQGGALERLTNSVVRERTAKSSSSSAATAARASKEGPDAACAPDAAAAAAGAAYRARALLTSYLAAIAHDHDHRGVNNDFLVRSAHPLALLYNDASPQEHHHVSSVFRRW